MWQIVGAEIGGKIDFSEVCGSCYYKSIRECEQYGRAPTMVFGFAATMETSCLCQRVLQSKPTISPDHRSSIAQVLALVLFSKSASTTYQYPQKYWEKYVKTAKQTTPAEYCWKWTTKIEKTPCLTYFSTLRSRLCQCVRLSRGQVVAGEILRRFSENHWPTKMI